MKLVYIILGSIVGLFLLVLVIATFAAGPIIRSYINDNGPSLIGRQMSVQDASFNAFTGSLQIDDLRIYEANSDSVFLSVDRFGAQLSMLKLLSGTYDLDDVEVARFSVNVEQRDTIFNFSDILDFLNESPDDEEPLPLVLRNINIHDSDLRYRDLLVHSDLRIQNFSLFIPSVDLRDIHTSVGADLSFVDGGQLHTQLHYNARLQSYSLDLDLSEFNIESLLPYVRSSIAFGEMKGILNLNLVMKGSIQHVLNFSLQGNAGVRDFQLLDPDGKSMVSCDTVSIGVRDFNLTQNRVELSHIVAYRPDISLQYGRDSLDNFSRLMEIAEREADHQPASSSADDAEAGETSVTFNGRQKDLNLIIDRFTIQDAHLSYLDESLNAGPFSYELNEFNFTAPNLNFRAKNHISITARLGSRGHLQCTYDGRLDDQRNIRTQIVANGIDFADFSPYTVHMFGNEVSSGDLSLNLLLTTINGELMGQSRIVLTNPTVEKKRRGVNPEMSIPFRTGMYLLTDRNNVCDIEFPIKGNLNEPHFSYKRVVFRTLGKLLVKVCTSPFRRNGSNSGVPFSDEEFRQDTRSLDDINLNDVSSDLMEEE